MVEEPKKVLLEDHLGNQVIPTDVIGKKAQLIGFDTFYTMRLPRNRLLKSLRTSMVNYIGYQDEEKVLNGHKFLLSIV